MSPIVVKKVFEIRHLLVAIAFALTLGAECIFTRPQIALPERAQLSVLFELPALILTGVALFTARRSPRWQRFFYWVLLFFLGFELYFRATLWLEILGSQF
jgi:hypothetical protein